MKIKRFVEKDMRRALRRVREDQGPDAVILSNRRVDSGIEVIAAVDYDEALIQQALRFPTSPVQNSSPTVIKSHIQNKATGRPARKRVKRTKKNTLKVVATNLQKSTAQRDDRPSRKIAQKPKVKTGHDVSMETLRSEITNMRGMFERQLSSLVWRDTASTSPTRAQILRNLTQIGIAPDISNIIVDRLEPIRSVDQLWRKPLHMLADLIPTVDDKLLSKGGVAAVVGPSGVGKTTSIAKIATRYAMKYGNNDIALISADAHRIGAQEHLSTFANILGITLHTAEDLPSLELLLNQLRDKRLVLIDTEGTSERDLSMTARLAAYGNNKERVHFYLTLAAPCQEAGLDETVRVFNRIPLSGAIVTKIDEAAQLGCVMSTLIRHDLPVAFLSNGQRVPDDLHLAVNKKLWLIYQAVERMRASAIKVSENTMIERFGNAGTANA